ncbi:hypothetical protein CULT_2200006 [[Clostridium] ultunense Esp]|nr:hypothetical protein CULT_2200006 [[Clostridium] ultunense Esp]
MWAMLVFSDINLKKMAALLWKMQRGTKKSPLSFRTKEECSDLLEVSH